MTQPATPLLSGSGPTRVGLNICYATFDPQHNNHKSMKIKFLLFLSVIPLLFTGCSSTQQFVRFPDQTKVVEDSSKGRIYVMRPATVGAAISMEVSDDGKIVGSTGPHGFLCWEREPGDAVISSKAENTSAVKVSVQAGKVNYIFQHMAMGLLIARNRLDVVSEDEGKKVLKECHPPTIIK
jgi:hypothetical protein